MPVSLEYTQLIYPKPIFFNILNLVAKFSNQTIPNNKKTFINTKKGFKPYKN